MLCAPIKKVQVITELARNTFSAVVQTNHFDRLWGIPWVLSTTGLVILCISCPGVLITYSHQIPPALSWNTRGLSGPRVWRWRPVARRRDWPACCKLNRSPLETEVSNEETQVCGDCHHWVRWQPLQINHRGAHWKWRRTLCFNHWFCKTQRSRSVRPISGTMCVSGGN